MSIDMSPEAIESRLRLASELRRLCLELAKGRQIPLELHERREGYETDEPPEPREATND